MPKSALVPESCKAVEPDPRAAAATVAAGTEGCKEAVRPPAADKGRAQSTDPVVTSCREIAAAEVKAEEGHSLETSKGPADELSLPKQTRDHMPIQKHKVARSDGGVAMPLSATGKGNKIPKSNALRPEEGEGVTWAKDGEAGRKPFCNRVTERISQQVAPFLLLSELRSHSAR